MFSPSAGSAALVFSSSSIWSLIETEDCMLSRFKDYLGFCTGSEWAFADCSIGKIFLLLSVRLGKSGAADLRDLSVSA